MTQYKDPTPTAGEPQQADSRQNNPKITTSLINEFMAFLFLLGFTVWLISCQPIPA